MFTFTNWQRHRRQPARHPGFGGVELLAATASALFLLLLGTPIYHLLYDRGPEHLLQEHSLASQLEYARQAAMLEETRVTVCPTRDGRSCLANGDWHEGWLIFVDDISPYRHFSVGDTLLHRERALIGRQPMVASMDFIQYQPDGSIHLD